MFIIISLFILSRSERPNDVQIEGAIHGMTLEEKVGQMSQIAIDPFVNVTDDGMVYSELIYGLNKYKIGSILNTYDRRPHTKDLWAYFLSEFKRYSDENRLEIPILYGLDSVHGAGYITNATLFPQQIGIAATFNRTIAEEGSRLSAYETRAASVHWTFSPVVDLGLDPRWPRIWEDFGEDPYLGGEMGAAMVRGFQGTNPNEIDEFHVAACVKHYIGYGNPFSGKDRTPALISENYLREYHLPAFKAVVDAGVASVMVNSGIVNGIPAHMSKFLLTDLLKGELKFEGVVVTDWQDIESLHTRDRVALSPKDAVRLAINAGIDMAMIPYNYSFCDFLIELVKEEKVSEERINDAVRRILKMKAKLDIFDNPINSPKDYPLFGSKEFEKIAYDAASESITLLKNENSTLPLAKGSKVLVVGPNSDSMRVLDGGWSYSWQGNVTIEYTEKYKTILKAIEYVNGAGYVKHELGVSYNQSGLYWEDYKERFDEAITLANSNDVNYIILCVGENSYTETPGNLQDLSLSDLQIELAEALIATGKPIILVLSEGRPRIIQTIADNVSAIVLIYLPGNWGGEALADILFGNVNPSGKLPITYPRYPHTLLTYWHKYSEEVFPFEGVANLTGDYVPLFEFGHGLSYTQFQYTNLILSKTTISERDTLNVKITIKNIGNRAGKEVVLLYTSDLYASITPDMKRLRRFEKVSLEPGQEITVSFDLTWHDLSFINIKNERVVEPGEFKVSIGGLSQIFTLQ